jgi:glucokinase
MIYPEEINYKIYKSVVKFTIVADIDGSYTRGNIVKDHQPRELQVIEGEDFDTVEENPLEFNITVEKHDSKTIVF